MSATVLALNWLFTTGVATHAGKVRARNEDSYLVQPDLGVWAVADGMGGHEAGALASATVVRSLESIGRAATAADLLARLEDRILRADRGIKEVARARGGVTIGTTVAVLLAYEAHYACVWSGDSRIYRVRLGLITQLSRDHTEVQELVDTGVLTPHEARTWPRRNVVTRALGVQEGSPELELDHGVIQAGDVFVICSDGLTGHVEDDEIRERVGGVLAPQAACDALVALTLDRGAADNVTVIVVRCEAGEPRSQRPLTTGSMSGDV